VRGPAEGDEPESADSIPAQGIEIDHFYRVFQHPLSVWETIIPGLLSEKSKTQRRSFFMQMIITRLSIGRELTSCHALLPADDCEKC
jgi:hypothetical protein